VVDSREIARLDEKERAWLRLQTVGVVFQEYNLIEEFTALENVALPLEAQGASSEDAFTQAAGELARVGLAGLGKRLPGELSGGQRQRVGIARALTGERRILLADEPTGSLDSQATLDLFKLVRALCDGGTLAVVCSHDPRCQEFADVVYEMADGRPLQRS
jgi:ABC-type lipoprotein export system ATPase subunit